MRKHFAVRTSAAIGLLFGALSVIAGSRVLAGIDRPDYVVLPWLVGYNIAAGILGVVVGVGLWQRRGWSLKLSWILASFHGAVLIVLIALLLAGGSVATTSLAAMLLRTLVWSSIATVASRALASQIH